ncbi:MULTISPECIES: L,D-transpeptidase family protein [unclassified Streptomyces]|uniref:L,D-transpeptidase family protein n=1 Tax=unclassified Streptomyces TaxID=2593676 RepID=UPI0036F5757E
MRHSGKGGTWRATGLTAAACALTLGALTACGGGGGHGGPEAESGAPAARPSTDPTRIPGVGDRLRRRIPADSRQVVAVYGDGKDAPGATVVLYDRRGSVWERVRSWPAHNGKKGWTFDHHEGDNRTPVGVFTLSDAGGVLPDPGAKLPYTESASFAAPHTWGRSAWHDFDYVIAIDYNRVKGTSPNDPTRPQGQKKGGSIWLHMDHGSGTSACVTLSRPAMEYLLRAIDPARHPVVVMGDKADLRA